MLKVRDFDFLKDVYDVQWLEIREQDIKELKDSTGSSPVESLTNIINYGDYIKVITDEYDRILAVFGVVDMEEYDNKNVGNIFFLATDEIEEKYPIEFLRVSKREVDRMLEYYDVLFNYVSSENHISIRWLQWLGFKVYMDKDVIFKNPDVPFYFFRLERK